VAGGLDVILVAVFVLAMLVVVMVAILINGLSENGQPEHRARSDSRPATDKYEREESQQ
jgi:hypothetical protein